MATCDRCRELLLDHAYGLVEGSDLKELEAHLADCSDCQAAFEQVQVEQQLLATAARAITDVAEFSLPTTSPASTEPPAALPISPSPRTKASFWRRPWVAWSAAAGILVAVGLTLSYYRQSVGHLQKELAAREREFKLTGEKLASLPSKYAALQKDAVADLQTGTLPYVHIVGPKTLVAGAKGHLHISTRDAAGHAVKSEVRVKVIDSESGNTVQEIQHLTCDRHAYVVLDASKAKPDSVLKVVVEAERGAEKARVDETLRTQAATFVTRIDTSKSAYQFKDLLFFRVVVLDRYTLRPPSQPIAMRVNLLNPGGQPVRSLEMQTGSGGVLAQEFAVDEKLTTGAYTLQVQPSDPNRIDVQSVSRQVEIVSELRVPELVSADNHLMPGNKGKFIYRGALPLPEKAMIGNQSVPITKHATFGAMSAPAGGGVGPKVAKGKKALDGAPMAQLFEVPIPPGLAGASTAQLSMKVGEGKSQREIRTELQLAPTEFTIDFFPEGGDLIAGVENRVYYRVRSKSGQPVTGDGKVILFPGDKGPIDSSYDLGMGFLTFVPDPKDTYSVRITTPTKTDTVPDPFARLGGIKNDGVVIHVPNSVGNQGDPIRLTLRQQGPSRKLLLVAHCRGQIVDQRWVHMRAKDVEVTLHPTHDAVGMIRVTAYEQHEKADPKEPTMIPVAERLIYRGAGERLDLGFKLNIPQPQGGQKLSAHITARDEKGGFAPAWLLASVVDERFQTRPRSLSAHFFLLNEIQAGSDLDSAQIILHDSPESAAILERFLGTHGWRRFVRLEEPSLGVLSDPAKRPAQPMVFSRESESLEALERKHEARIEQALAPIHKAGFLEAENLKTEREERGAAVQTAARDLHAFEESVQLGFRLGLGVLLALLLVLSILLMAFGALAGWLGMRQAATPSLGSAFACLAACLGIIFLGTWLGPLDVTVFGDPSGPGMVAREANEKLEALFAQQPVKLAHVQPPMVGAFALQGPASRERNDMKKSGKIAEQESARAAAQILLRSQLAQSLTRRENAAVLALQSDSKADAAGAPADAMKAKRFADARDQGLQSAKGDQVTPPKVPAAKINADGKEYAHQHVPNLQSDTLLWHPTLWLANGNAEVRFDMANGLTTYRVVLLGHGPTGRFGLYETRLDVTDLGR